MKFFHKIEVNMSAVRIFAIGAVLALAGCSGSAPPDVEKVIEN